MNNIEKYNQLNVKPEFVKTIKFLTDKINQSHSRYEDVSFVIGVPWQVIACIHSMESALDFGRILHNGEKLPVEKTVLVPKGRGPFKTWEGAAIDALQLELRSNKNKDLGVPPWTIDKTLDFLERYNGLGYRKKGVPSPYLWSGTQFYTSGKFIEVLQDGKYVVEYKPDLVSKQLGVAPLLKALNFKGA